MALSVDSPACSAVLREGYAPGKGLLQHAAQVADGQLGQAAAKADFHAEILPARLAALQQPLLLQIRRQALNQALEGLPQGGSLISCRGGIPGQSQFDLSGQLLRQGAAHQTAGVAYCASKAALVSATRNTAYMYMEQGIRCNAISPGGVLTDIPLVMPKADEFGFGRTSALLAHSPEMGMPEDIANAALFLADDASKFINGVVLACDGGWTCF